MAGNSWWHRREFHVNSTWNLSRGGWLSTIFRDNYDRPETFQRYYSHPGDFPNPSYSLVIQEWLSLIRLFVSNSTYLSFVPAVGGGGGGTYKWLVHNWGTSWSAIFDQSCMSEIPLWHYNCVVIALWRLMLSLTYKIYPDIWDRTPGQLTNQRPWYITGRR